MFCKPKLFLLLTSRQCNICSYCNENVKEGFLFFNAYFDASQKEEAPETAACAGAVNRIPLQPFVFIIMYQFPEEPAVRPADFK